MTATKKTTASLQILVSIYYSFVNVATHAIKAEYHLCRLAAEAQRCLEGRQTLGTGRFHATLPIARISLFDTILIPWVWTSGLFRNDAIASPRKRVVGQNAWSSE